MWSQHLSKRTVRCRKQPKLSKQLWRKQKLFVDNHCPSRVPCAIHNSVARHWRPSVFPTKELWRRQHQNKRVSWKLYQWCDCTLWLQALVYVCFFHGENVGEVFVLQEKQLAWFLCNLQSSRWVFDRSKLTANCIICIVKLLSCGHLNFTINNIHTAVICMML